MKKINFKSISQALTNKQLKNILGGSYGGGSGFPPCFIRCTDYCFAYAYDCRRATVYSACIYCSPMSHPQLACTGHRDDCPNN